MKRIALATRSAHKAQEIRQILGTAPLQLLSLADLDIPATAEEDLVENAVTFVGNAIAKARYFAALTGLPTIADDSGLEVDALGRRPGVRTRRFALDHGYSGPGGVALDQANNTLLLDKLRAVPDTERTARYVCAAALAWPAPAHKTAPQDTTDSPVAEHAGSGTFAGTHRPQRTLAALGTCEGRIAHELRGTGGFGYDPLFLLPDLDITFAELSAGQKNARSHRARAFRALVPLL